MITFEEVIGTLKVYEDKLKYCSIKIEEKALSAKAFGKSKKKDLDNSHSSGRGHRRGRNRGPKRAASKLM